MSQSRERQLRAKSGREQTQQISPLFDHRVGSGENTLLPIVHVEVDNVGREMVLPRIDRSCKRHSALFQSSL